MKDSHDNVRPEGGQPHQPQPSANLLLHSLMEAEEAMLRSWDQGFINSLLLANSSSYHGHHHHHSHHQHHKWKHVKRDKAFYLDPAKAHFLLPPETSSESSTQEDHNSPSHNKFTFHRAPKPLKGRYFVVVTSPKGNGDLTSNQTAMNRESDHVRNRLERRKVSRGRRHHHHNHHHRGMGDT